MRTKLSVASGIAVAATMLTALLGPTGSGAFAEESVPTLVPEPIQIIEEPAETATPDIASESVIAQPAPEITAPAPAETLAQLIGTQAQPASLNSEMRCLAGAIYFEARGESLAGQLAVGRVVVERAESGRFPNSYCGVVFQRSQFSFVRGRSLPPIREASPAWQRAVAIAQIANTGSWDSPAEGALFFHAARVSPGWRLKRLAQVDNHIFYR